MAMAWRRLWPSRVGHRQAGRHPHFLAARRRQAYSLVQGGLRVARFLVALAARPRAADFLAVRRVVLLEVRAVDLPAARRVARQPAARQGVDVRRSGQRLAGSAGRRQAGHPTIPDGAPRRPPRMLAVGERSAGPRRPWQSVTGAAARRTLAKVAF